MIEMKVKKLSLMSSLKACDYLNLIEDYKDEKDVLYYCTDDSVAMVFS